ncbi:hypothetical protein ACKGJY_06295 [Hyunsoonleella sp. 2307UL5-6]|uniref:hypothetical protein n=1 Tax=Hyunsoonleella sp. 2307UL5-6 TaxID=3384768 RepID=UPI0039BD69B3
MISVKDSNIYKDVIKELNYNFADVFVFENFVISEIKEGIVFNWEDHAKLIIKDVIAVLDTDGSDLTYVSNRIHSYSVMPQDWVKFFKNEYSLKGYCVISDKKTSMLSFMVESLFFNNRMKRFTNIYEAVNYLQKGVNEVA